MNYQKMTKKQLIDLLLLKESPVQCNTPNVVFDTLLEYWDSEQENFIVVMLDGNNNIKGKRLVTKGTLNRCLVHPREVYAPAVEMRAACILVAHNHPSGNVQPSMEDVEVANQLKKAGAILGIPLVDSITFSNTEYYSMKEQGEL